MAKPHARTMEYLAEVHDGSEQEITSGYWCISVVAAAVGSPEVVPLYQDLYSQRAPHFESENDEILRAIRSVSEATGGRGIWMIDLDDRSG